MYLRIALLLILSTLSSAHAAAGLEIYFVRHAETMANLSGNYDTTSSNTFSADGLQQIASLTGWLQQMEFDALLVSSVPRALDTLLPYLQQSGRKGEIWPELAECCWQRERDNPAGGRLTLAEPITLSKQQAEYFAFRDEEAMRDYGNDSYADGVAHVRKGVVLLKQRYINSGKRILIVAHYHSGQVLLAELLQLPREEVPKLRNGKVTRLRQEADGHFTLLEVNIAPDAR